MSTPSKPSGSETDNEVAADSAGPPPATSRDELRRALHERVRALVATAVHDRVIPQDLRGRDVPFERKTDALDERVRAWVDRLSGTGLPELERLARRLRRCQSYGRRFPAGAAGGPSPCNAHACPNCYARQLDYQYRRLLDLEPKVLTVAPAVSLINTASPLEAKMEVRFIRQHLPRYVSYFGRHVVTRLAPMPVMDNGHSCRLLVIAVFPGDTPLAAAATDLAIPLAPKSAGLEHYAVTQYAADDAGLAQMLTDWWRYVDELMADAAMDHVGRLPSWLGRISPFDWVEPYRFPPPDPEPAPPRWRASKQFISHYQRLGVLPASSS